MKVNKKLSMVSLLFIAIVVFAGHDSVRAQNFAGHTDVGGCDGCAQGNQNANGRADFEQFGPGVQGADDNTNNRGNNTKPKPKPLEPKPTETTTYATISCTPPEINSGESSVVSWECLNGTKSINNSGNNTNIIEGTTSGSFTVSPSKSTGYGVSCFKKAAPKKKQGFFRWLVSFFFPPNDIGSSATCNVMVKELVLTTKPTATISCTPNHIELGGMANVSWTCGNDSENIYGGTAGNYQVTPAHSKIYTVTCAKGLGASYQQTQAACVVNVGDEVLPDPTVVTGGYGGYSWPGGGGAGAGVTPTVDITAGSILVRRGYGSKISWTSHNATNCNITGPGLSSVDDNGSKVVGIQDESRFTIACDGGLTDSVTVRVLPDWNEQ
jgi:hypothetical protein